ncbi:MAG: IS4 family transposase [Flavobacteriales bacterium]|nr:IS4 family transposase [Flavobacteriales bacterium]NCQ15189.1 IS4 family transposase [Flavobacteriales bacterium]
MSKDSEKKLVGQPIFKQIVNILPKEKFDVLVQKYNSNRYYKTFSSWDQLVTMLFGILSRCDSMNEVCDSMQALQGKLNYFGMDSSPAKSTAGDGLRNRSNELFRDYYFALLDHFTPLLSVSRIKDVSFDKFFIFDSTTIRLFSDIMKGVGRNPKNDGKKKGGLKVHMMIDAHSNTAKFVKISEAKLHDKNFLKYLILPPHSMIVFDKAYNHYSQFAQWTRESVNFVCRLKSNAVYEVQDVKFEKTLTDEEYGVMKEEHIHMKYKVGKNQKTLCLRKVTYKDEKGRIYEFITNNFEISNEEVAFLYKKRWDIELLFKKLKQNFQLHYFYSETENGIRTQVWCTLIAHLLLTVLKVITKTQKAFSTIAALIRIYLISHLDMYWVIENCRRTYVKKNKIRNKSPAIQLSLF